MNSLPTDKILHFAVGALIGLAATVILNPVAGVTAALLAGCAKEWVWDAWMKRGEFDPWDAFATAIGGLTVSVLYAAAQLFPT